MGIKLIVFNDGREPIVVSDEEIVNCKVFDFNHNIISDSIYYNKKEDKVFKIIAQGSQIDFNGLESEFGVVDVDKLARSWFDTKKFSSDIIADIPSYKEGFKASQQLNTKKFSEKDVIEFTMNMISQYVQGNTNIWNPELLKESIQSLSKPYQVFDVEVEMELLPQAYGHGAYSQTKVTVVYPRF